MGGPKISVIICIYNVEPYLRRCIESVTCQTHHNLEILLVDDGSPDGCPGICDEYAAKDARIHVIHKANGGISEARNVGIDAATGAYILFVDGDDWIDPETCEAALTAALQENADIVMFSYIREYTDRSIVKHIFDQEYIVFDEQATKYRLFRRLFGLTGKELSKPQNADVIVSSCMKLYRKELVRSSFIATSVIGTEDALFNIDTFKSCKRTVYLDRAYYHYRKTNAHSITSVHKPHLFEQWQILFYFMKQRIDEYAPEPVFYKALDNRIALSVIGLGLNEAEAQKPFSGKAERIAFFLQDNRYKQVLHALECKNMPIPWRIFFLMARLKLAVPLTILLQFMHSYRKLVH